MTVLETADRLFSAIEEGDKAAVANMWSDDVTVWRTGRRPELVDDKPRALRVINWFISATTQRAYQILDREVFDNGFVQQHILRATGLTGQAIAMRVCIVIKLDTDGLINRIDEYFDPEELAPLLDRDPR
ncbi:MULTISPECIES: nuclear transport factor 2 family protein [Mycobacterium]|uniref:Ketosteroid isomerase n=1 Tax=Mycobacterium kiyosense TaxID=2871094 RepID=A0A9P3QBC9_9MYCO|nr:MULTISPECIES: nuclear transport factor 2 family protein [Mycobacterium]BDB41077.1 ketosteroid isomerase [Mycobacterium kiyosense]BDE12870.1 ketosteroid isomerase [Mycobacterium sp. 20KCMC460]GLB84299.1 ketosteroid isomerase [Mycobacterium kiyosense]GLB90251.1 ketosteroid isomerase [Mycobacterium kiyosense]GLB97706.1 ketosteroid isomerase [Mycobacterium kiyosense]